MGTASFVVNELSEIIFVETKMMIIPPIIKSANSPDSLLVAFKYDYDINFIFI